MPKLLHALCCCIRPRAYSKKNDAQPNGDYNDGRKSGGGRTTDPSVSPITQQQLVKGGHQSLSPANTQASKLVGNIKHRLLMSPHQHQGTGTQQLQEEQQQKRQFNKDKDKSVTVLVGIDQKQPGPGHTLQQHPLGHHQQHAHQHFLLPRVAPQDVNKKCLIVDLDETLVHSSFKPVKNADFVIPVEIDNVVHQVYVLKRPHTDKFLERIGSLFECVLFTASLSKYADPVADLLDQRRIFRARLFREACVFYEGNYVKDLDRLGRELRNVVIIDNSPASYSFHPDNAIPVRTWFDDPNDHELLDLLPLLDELAHADEIYSVLGTVPPSQQPRCLTPSEDMLLPPPMAPSSPITQVLPPSPNNNNGKGSNLLPQHMNTTQSSAASAEDDTWRGSFSLKGNQCKPAGRSTTGKPEFISSARR